MKLEKCMVDVCMNDGNIWLKQDQIALLFNNA
jgi:hypothetical protein